MVSIRIARDQDVTELSRLSTQLGYPCSPDQVLTFFADIVSDPNHCVFVAETDDGSIAGYVHVFKAKRLFIDPFSELGGLVVGNNFRGKGIGTTLLAASETWAKENGCFEMRVRSNVIREEAHIFYLDHGYLSNKEQKIFIKGFS